MLSIDLIDVIASKNENYPGLNAEVLWNCDGAFLNVRVREDKQKYAT